MISKYINNPVYNDLKNLRLIKDKDIVLINSKTRDKQIRVLQDRKTKIIFLEKFIRSSRYYKKLKGQTRSKLDAKVFFRDGSMMKLAKVNYKDKKISVQKNIVGDDVRRFDTFKKLISKKNICDFGCGYAGFLTLSSKITKKTSGVELNNFFLDYLKREKKYIDVKNDIDQFKSKFDIITLFHVLEHIPNQVETLKNIKKKLNNKGKIIIEVPHAKDFLLEKLDLSDFKNFIFWSEHLILHTEKSLIVFLKKQDLKILKLNFVKDMDLQIT